jgi:hypothetical protein
MKLNEPQNIEQNFDELELVAEKAGELNDRVGKIENELGAQTKTLESAAMVLDAAIKGLGALKHQVLENDIGALQLALNDKTAHLAREIGRFESAVAEIDRRAEAGDEQLAASLRDIALGLRSSFDAKSAEIAEWSVRVEREIAAHSVALAAIPPVIKGADAKPFNPRGEWQAGMVANSLDVVSYNGSSYISNEDGNTDKPTRSTKYTVLAKRSGNGAGGATDFGSLTGTILPAQVVPGSATYAVGDVLYAGTTGALSKLTAGSSGQLLSTQGAGAAPRWVSATGGSGDVNGPASATDNAIVRFDGTGGKTVQNSAVTIADTTGDIAGASSLTAPAATALTLAGGSTGASLVLGQGTNADATIAYKGTGKVAFNRWVAASATAPAALAAGSGAIYFQANGSVAGTQDTWVFDTGFTDQSYRFKVAGTDKMVIAANTGNLLIGTTTDITGTGGLHVAGTSTASTTTSGALRVGSNVGLSGNAGGASYFGGDILAGQSTATNGIRVSASAIAGESSIFLRDTGTITSATAALTGTQSYTILNAPTGGTLYLRRGNDSAAGLTFNGTTAAFGSGAIVTVANTTASTNTTSGALVVTGGVGVGGAMNVGSTVRATTSANSLAGTVIATNANAGTNAGSVFSASNGTASGWFGISGTGYTTYGIQTANSVGIYTDQSIFIASDNPSGRVKIGVGSGIPVVGDFSSTGLAVTGTLSTTGAATFAGAVSLSTAGTTISIKSGANAAAGTITLTGGAATITSTAIDVNTVIVMSIKTKSGSFDHAPSVVVAAGSATIDGHNADASTYNWIALKVN